MSTANPPSSTQTPLAPPDQTLVARTIEAHLPPGLILRQLKPLTGDASNRRYYRAEVAGGPPHSVILMQLAEPEGFKQSEEAVSGATHHITELPFLNILSHLAKAGVPVPSLHYYDQAAGLLYLEDFGDVTLAEAVSRAEASKVEVRYKQAIDVLVQLQVKATTPADPGCLAFHRSFDVPLLMWEFDHFIEYGIVARHGKPMGPEDLDRGPAGVCTDLRDAGRSAACLFPSRLSLAESDGRWRASRGHRFSGCVDGTGDL